ncbi:unnamed protein product, partial [marine sediment metagenome]
FLTSEKIRRETIDAKTTRKYVGGRGLGIRIFYDELKPKTDPL